MKGGVRRTAQSATLSLLLSMTSTALAAPDDCSKAPFGNVPPSEREWSLLARDSHRFRARLLSSDGWIYLGNPLSNADGLRARGGEGWDTGRLVYSDSLIVRWDEIERLECNRGSYAARGILLGAMVGGVVYAGFRGDGWGWSLLSVPVGMLIGGIIGGSFPIWRAVYCAPPTEPGDGSVGQ